jgi:NADH-quinone oxidoreductase subunit D
MEALIYHFKIVMGEIDMPPGEVYQSVEGGNGEFRVLPDQRWRQNALRLHFRRPCFIYYQAYEEMTKGRMLSDAIIDE